MFQEIPEVWKDAIREIEIENFSKMKEAAKDTVVNVEIKTNKQKEQTND